MDDLKLRPCPFCGSKHVRSDFMETDKGIASWIRCLDCGAYGPSAFAYIFYGCADPTAEMVRCAVENWNRRAVDGDD